MTTATLWQHKNLRHAAAPCNVVPIFAKNDPRWRKVGPVDVSSLGVDDSPTAFMTPEEKREHDRCETVFSCIVMAVVAVAVFACLWAVRT